MKKAMHNTTKFLSGFAVAIIMITGCRTSTCPLTEYRVGDSIDTSKETWRWFWKRANIRTRGVIVAPDCDITLEEKNGRLVGTIIWYECKTIAERDRRFEEVKEEISEYYKDFLVERGAKESKVIIRGIKETPLEGSTLLPAFHFICRTPEFDKEASKKFGPQGGY